MHDIQNKLNPASQQIPWHLLTLRDRPKRGVTKCVFFSRQVLKFLIILDKFNISSLLPTNCLHFY